MDDPDLEALKADMRRAKRVERSLAAHPEAALKLMEHFPLELGRINPVAGYWPVSTEMDPRPLLAALAKAGRQIALPRMETRQGPARFLHWKAGEPLQADAFGVPSPPASSRELRPRLILVPLLAFDRAGRRLGQGGGHYDRILAVYRAEGALAVGLAYSEQEVDLAPTGPFDVPLDWVITEREAIQCARQGSGLGLRGLSGA